MHSHKTIYDIHDLEEGQFVQDSPDNYSDGPVYRIEELNLESKKGDIPVGSITLFDGEEIYKVDAKTFNEDIVEGEIGVINQGVVEHAEEVVMNFTETEMENYLKNVGIDSTFNGIPHATSIRDIIAAYKIWMDAIEFDRENADHEGDENTVSVPEWEGEAPTNYQHIRESMALAFHCAGVSQETVTEAIKTVDEAVVNNETHLAWENDYPNTTAELKRTSEGVGLSLYDHGVEPVSVLDEMWWTWPEFTGMDTTDLPISTGGTTTLEPPNRNSLDDKAKEDQSNTNNTTNIDNGRVVTSYTNYGDLEPVETNAIESKVAEIIDNVDLDTEARDPLVITVGDVPNYNNRLPYDDVCTEYETELGHQLIAYRPRAWSFHSDGTMTLEDGSQDEAEGESEFEVTIPADDLLGYWSV